MLDDRTTKETQYDAPGLSGVIADRFLICERLGAGGMGEVYRAEDRKLNRPVALKRISPRHKQNPQYRARFKKEAERASILYDSHIASIHDVIEFENEILLVMEYIEGRTLRTYLGNPYAVPDFLRIAIQCSQGLIAAHAKGVVHRDIKPENIMLTGSGQIKICDFGLAKQLTRPQDSTLTALLPKHISGTPAYMAPECLLGSVGDQRVDIFSLGVVFYEMLTGKNPFADNNAAVRERVTPISELNSVVPVRLSQVVSKMLARDPDARYSTAEEVLSALRDIQDPSGWQRHVRWVLLSAAALIILFLSVALIVDRNGRKPAALTERDYLLISHISNRSGDPVFEDTLDSALASQISQSPFLNIVSDQRVQNALRFMGKPADAVLTSSVALEVCKRESLKAMLTGSLAKIGNQYVFSVTAMNCETGDSMATEQTQVSGREAVLGAVGAVASKLRGKLGESLASIRKFDEPIESATTPSLEAFRAFTLGNAARRRGNTEEALAFFKHAVELDPNFALAYARLSQTYYNREERSAGAEYARRAFELRDRVSEREKLYIAITYYHTVTGETEKTPGLYDLWRQTFPRDVLAYTGQVWISLDMGLNIDRTIQLAKTAVEIDPDHVPANGWLAMSYLANNQFDEARTVIERRSARGLEGAQAHALLYWIALAQNDLATANAQLEWARKRPSERSRFSLQEAHATAFSGKLRQARALYQQGSEAAQQFNLSESAATILAENAYTEAELGSQATVLPQVSAALKIARDRHPLGLCAIALARVGAVKGAESLIAELSERFPDDFHVKSIWTPIARAAIALNQGKADSAIQFLKPTVPYELGTDSFVGTGFRPIYLRGQAYLAMKAGPEAIQEFEKITNHRGIFPVSPLYPLAYLGIARAYALSGDISKSRHNYHNFLALWKDADPDLSILNEARSELDRLNRQH